VATILEGWGARVASLEVVAGTGGVFDVDVNGERLFTKSMIGRYPEPEDVMPLLREAIGPE
jgi:selenoprotein W-related protein